MKRFYVVLSILFVFAVGCSGGGNSPVMPQKTPDSISNLPVLGLEGIGDVSQSTGILGAYELNINPLDMTYELISKRAGAIGDSYGVDGGNFFIMSPCGDCLQIVGIAPDPDGNLLLTFEITHPFDPADMGKPPSAKNRNDLDVFDLAMVIHPTSGTATAFAQTGASAYTETCVGPDGYTTELANMLTDTAALPYFLCIDDSTDATPPVSTWNKFGMGTSTTFDVGFDISGPLVFDTYITMGYGHSAKKPDRLTPKYYNPEFNRKAAWKVVVEPPTGTGPGTTWDTTDTYPQSVVVKVFDWQIGAPVSAEPDFGDALETEIFAASDPSTVSVEVLGLSASLPSSSAPDVPGATGGPDDPWVYTIPVPVDATPPPVAGTYPGIVAVNDARVPGALPGTTNDYLISTPDGILLDFYDIPAYVTYQSFTALVVVDCGPIMGSINVPAACPVTGVADGGTINFEVLATSGNGGDPITLYEMDYDYDGVTFDVDDSNATGLFVGAGPFTVDPPCASNIPGDTTVAFRATDSCATPNVTVFATCVVTVDNCLGAVGDIQLVVNRVGGTFGIDSSAQWTLSWAAAGGAADYGIYYDSDPTDGLTNNLVACGSTAGTSTTWDAPTAHWTNNQWYSVGNTYVVFSRSTLGDPGSESGTASEPAFVSANSWETQSEPQIVGEGWSSMTQTSNSYYFYSAFVLNYWATTGSRSCRLGAVITYPGYTEWVAIVKQTPTVPNSTVRHVSHTVQHGQGATTGGTIMGTIHSNTPAYGWSTTTDVEWSDSDGTAPYTAYNKVSSDIAARVGGVPGSGNQAWGFAGWPLRGAFASDVNESGDPTEDYVIVLDLMVNLNGYGFQMWGPDDLAIAIY